MSLTAEEKRLEEARQRLKHWKRWGPYLSERAWGTVREDYSPQGDAWQHLTHERARHKAYRWGEDGLGGICDRRQYICFALTLWNGRDPFLKERAFGLTGREGNHGEDVKEYYFYLDSTPTHSYMRYLYKYPQREFPYQQLVEENRRRDRTAPEFELADTGVFDEDRYFDVFVEYAKRSPEDILIRVSVVNRGPERAELHLLPTIWFRNTWSWNVEPGRAKMRLERASNGHAVIRLRHFYLGRRWLCCEGSPIVLFTENVSNRARLYGTTNESPYVTDGIDDYVVNGVTGAVNPAQEGTKAAIYHRLSLAPGEEVTVRFLLGDEEPSRNLFGESFDKDFSERKREADDFFAKQVYVPLSEDARRVQRQAFAGLMWSKQFFYYDVYRWLHGDSGSIKPPQERLQGRNSNWRHLYNADVISMPDKWEYPWYATWDLAFHTIPIALMDPDFAKEQLLLFLREWYMHPNGQLPAYEWNFDDVNPPVHAWAAWRVYKIEEKRRGSGDLSFLSRVFHKLLLNFTWWVNRKDAGGRNVFEGGFLGLDNIGVFDRSKPLPTGGHLEQSDGTSWMGMYCLNMLRIALELTQQDRSYADVASKFFEHFVYITRSMNNVGGKGYALWDEQDGFYYDVLHPPDGTPIPLKIRSIVGLIPLFAVDEISTDLIESLPDFRRRTQWFLKNRPEFIDYVETKTTEHGPVPEFLALVNRTRLRRILRYMLSEDEFLSPFGIRSLSKHHQHEPYRFYVHGQEHRVDYEPGESSSFLFGGNSNWRGPIWLPINFLLVESLQKFHHYLGDDYRVECPTGSGRLLTLWEVAAELSRRLNRLFLKGADSKRPLHGNRERFHTDPNWNQYIPFHEYFHADTGAGLGASHQTGWTALVAKTLQQSGE